MQNTEQEPDSIGLVNTKPGAPYHGPTISITVRPGNIKDSIFEREAWDSYAR